MTVENCIRLLKVYEERVKNPKGADSTEKAYAKRNSEKAYANMKQHILKSRKFVGHPILFQLGYKPVVKPEEKKDGKKSKG